MEQLLVPGGWTPYRPLTTADKQLFNKVTGQIIGVTYAPTEVASQVVQGINYKLRAVATIPNYDSFHVVITIFEPLPDEGEPVLVSIVRA